jgi:tRNA-dihydrouridine synthase A
MLGLYQGEPGARRFRRHLSEIGVSDSASIEVLREAVHLVENFRQAACAPQLAAE